MTLIPVTIGRHQVQRPLGRGGMGTVYLAWDPKLERQLAVKLLKEDDSDLRERFEREAIAAARLRHPHIVTIYDVGDHDGQPFIAMEYVTGQTLADAIRAREPLPMSRKLDLIRQVCDGLGFAHRTGIVHRDVKPANMMVDATGSLKILDFGIARIAESASMTQAGMMMGTLNYMSPEQVTGQTVDQRSDIFAVGALLYELVSYQQAFPGTLSTGVLNRILNEPPRSLADLCPGIDPEIVRVVGRAIEKEAGRRYQDLQSMDKDILAIRARLDSSGADRPVAAPVYAPAPTPRPGNREELMRRRQLQIDAHLARAAQALAGGDYEAVIAACDDVRLLDADEARALDLIGQAQTALNQRQAQAWLAEAQQGLQRGAFTAARELIERAATLAPGSTKVIELRQALDEAVRVRDDARRRQQQRQALLANAESSLDLGQFEDALRAADEFLAEEPEHAGARLVRTQASDGLLAQSRQKETEAAHRRAREAVEQAEGRVRAGDHTGAMDLLARFEPPHEVVSRALAQMRADAGRAVAAPSPHEAGQTLLVPAAERAEAADVAGGTVLIGRTTEQQQRPDAVAAQPAGEKLKGAEDRRPAPQPHAPVRVERPKYVLPALAATGLLVFGGLAAYWFSRTPEPAPAPITQSADPPPPASPAPPSFQPPPPTDPAPTPSQPAPPQLDEWRRAESAAAEARRAADAAGQRAVTTSTYREGRAQEQQAVASYGSGRVSDAIAAAGRAVVLYGRAVREASAGPREPVRVGAGVPAPRLVKSVDPVYPAAALATRVSGSVRVEALIDPSGRVTGASIVRSLQPLDEAALEAVRQWEFTPTLMAGAPVAVLHTVDVPFAAPPAPEPINRPAPEPPAAPPTTLPAVPAPADERPAVRATIQRLARAYSEINVKAILAIYPTADQAGLARMARDIEAQTVEVTGEQVTVSSGTRATLTCTWVVTSRPRNSGQRRNSSRATFELEKKGGGWVVVARR